MSASLALERVSKCQGGKSILADCDFLIAEGDHTAILGRSGTGKSTLLRLLAGLELPSSGRVLVDGMVASEAHAIILPPHQRRIAMVFQDLGLWPGLSAAENVLLATTWMDRTQNDRKMRALAALRLCGIEDVASRRPGALSGGEQQRVALARAIAAEPRFLFLDEPFAGLDICTKRELLHDIAELSASCGSTIVIVTHDPAEALGLCGRAVVLEGGRVRDDGPWAALLRDPRSDVLQAFREWFQRDGEHVSGSQTASSPEKAR